MSIAGGVLMDPGTGEPMLYIENLFVRFVDSADPYPCKEVLRAAGPSIKSELGDASNACFVEAQEGTGRNVFDIAVELFKRDDVEF